MKTKMDDSEKIMCFMNCGNEMETCNLRGHKGVNEYYFLPGVLEHMKKTYKDMANDTTSVSGTSVARIGATIRKIEKAKAILMKRKAAHEKID